MFDRITISQVPESRVARIAFSMLKPVGWKSFESADDWLAFGPKWRRDAGFFVIMRNNGIEAPEQLLSDPRGLASYVNGLCPDFVEIQLEDEDDDFCPYDMVHFHGRIEGVPGRLMLSGTAMEIEDVNFALCGFARDEIYHKMHATFRSMVCSFQPMVLPL